MRWENSHWLVLYNIYRTKEKVSAQNELYTSFQIFFGRFLQAPEFLHANFNYKKDMYNTANNCDFGQPVSGKSGESFKLFISLVI